jgi:hypothetical protein
MTDLRAVGVITGWGDGVQALPADAARAAGHRSLVALERPRLDGERFRRATRECLLGVAAVRAVLERAGQRAADIAGQDTGLLYVTAAGYGASNRAFVEAATAGTLHFPYTAPSAVPAEVAIEFGLTGAYVIFVGGATATIEALAHAARLVRQAECERVLVLAVETFAECEELFARGRWLVGRPLVEAAACAFVGPGEGRLTVGDAPAGPTALSDLARRRAGETLACGPLIALALGLESGDDRVRVTGEWRGRRLAAEWASPQPASQGTEPRS